jgi:hypothetical protein
MPSKYPNKFPIKKPNVVLDYTKHMGGVKRSDYYVASYIAYEGSGAKFRQSLVESLVYEKNDC